MSSTIAGLGDMKQAEVPTLIELITVGEKRGNKEYFRSTIYSTLDSKQC